MRAAGWQDCSSHHLRSCANVTLSVLGVSEAEVCTRAGWSSKVNSTRIDHYSTFRLTHRNFAALLVDGKD